VDNSIKLKELQVESETLRKKDKGLSFFLFKGIFFGWGKEDKIIWPLYEEFFWVGLEKVIFLGDGGLSQGVFFGWHGREKFGPFSRLEGWGFFCFQKVIVLVMWDGVVGEGGGYIFFFFLFFLS
jgi:hypothetical protein